MQGNSSRDLTEISAREMPFTDVFKCLFDSASDAIFVLNRHGECLVANRKAEKLTSFKKGETIEELLGKIVSKGNLQEAMQGFVTALKGKSTRFELELGTAAKWKAFAEITVTPLTVRGRTLGILGIVKDISEHKTLEERLFTLNCYGRRMNAAQRVQQVYELTLDAIEHTLGFENAAFMVMEKGKLLIGSQRGYQELSLELPLDGSKRGITVKAASTHQTQIISDVRKDIDYVEGASSVRSEIAVPVETEGGTIGILDVESKQVGAFDEKDAVLLQILASHAAAAMSDLRKREVIEERSNQLVFLMNNAAEMIRAIGLSDRLQQVAESIRQLGWRRVVIRAFKDESMEIADPKDMVTAGLSDREKEHLWINRAPGQVWRERFGPEYERFKIGEFYHLPWSDPWVRERFATGVVSSKLSEKDMVDWDPQDLLYAPLRLMDGRIIGIISVDDPVDGKRPTTDSLVPLELFINQAAVAIENAQLIQELSDARNQVREYADQLELKVAQRTQELVEAQDKLLKTERLAAIGEIAAMVGHDLRNPLTGITGAAYYLRMKLGARLSSKQREMLELIDKDIEYSNKIINDLLDYSREISLELRKTSPATMVKEALSVVDIPRNIRILNSAHNKPSLLADPEKMMRVFVNLIRNAVDAMPKGGTLAITSEAMKNSLEICFTDTGIGMSADILRKIWSPLFTTKAKGMGFGLSICKRIIEAHGGHIAFESEVGMGTTFKLTLPIRPRSEAGGEEIWVDLPEYSLSTTTKA